MKTFDIADGFPTVVTSNSKLNLRDLTDELHNHKTILTKLLLKNGALLFRDFPLKTADDFANFVEAINLGKFVNYIAGDSPRDKVKNKVYTSTETPPEFYLPLHQELSYVKYFPQHIYFFCEVAPLMGGETIIADARQVYKKLDTNIVSTFNEKGLTYISHYYYKSKIMALLNKFKRSHKSWVEVFETNDKEKVERLCQENEINLSWLAKDWIEMKQTRPALLEHPVTKETVWFNQAHLYDFNPRLLGWMRYIAVKLFYMRPSTRLHEITFADGRSIPRQNLYHILDVLNECTVSFPWQRGDVMVLDNILTMHGRNPYKGKRRILTALTM